ncbi:MAG: glycine cleavage system protein GcvH [Halodesulfurarchaeum sp.]
MTPELPDDLVYAESHEWIDPETGRVGITDHAQDELGDVVFVELPGVGDSVSAGEEAGVVESIKAISDIYSPVSGSIDATNDDVVDEPELINTDPYGDGWLFTVAMSDEEELDDLLSATEYEAQLE